LVGIPPLEPPSIFNRASTMEVDQSKSMIHVMRLKVEIHTPYLQLSLIGKEEKWPLFLIIQSCGVFQFREVYFPNRNLDEKVFSGDYL
jgi:hypothetical protein